MGELRTVRADEHFGLTRPYCQDKEYVNIHHIQPCKINGKTNRLNTLLDPYSIYDDDSDQDINFIVPAGKLNLARFQRAFSEMNSLNDKVKDRTIPTCPNKRGGKFVPNSGDYCHLSADAKIPETSKTNSFCNHHINIKKENFQKFASKLVTSDTPIDNTHHCVHSFERRGNCQRDSCVEFEFDNKKYKSKLKKNHKKIDNIIDCCTCMVCVKAVSYHWTKDDIGDEYIEPCSCTGTPKKVAGRWFCMGLLALFLPCLFCYLPAKLCRSACCECPTSRSKLKDETRVLYRKDNNANHTNL